MAIFLDEDMVGADANVIIYPRLLLCMGVTVLMSDGWLVGGHVSDHTTELHVLGEIANQIAARPGAHTEHLYCTGNYARHRAHGGLKVSQKAAALGYHGPAFRFDTPDYTHGTALQITSNGAGHKCSIEYKRDNKVAYQQGAGPMVAQWSSFQQQFRNVATPKTGFAAAVPNPHQVNLSRFALEVKRYQIP